MVAQASACGLARAGIRPLLRPFRQASSYRIALDVYPDSLELAGVTNPVVVKGGFTIFPAHRCTVLRCDPRIEALASRADLPFIARVIVANSIQGVNSR